MSFNPEQVDTINQDSVDQSGPQFPIIQWSYGDQKMKKAGGIDYLGGFFISHEYATDPDALTAAGWEATTITHHSGEMTEGFWRKEMTFSLVASRRRWEVRQEGNRRHVYAWNQYDEANKHGRATSRAHILTIIQGLEELGPHVITLAGTAAMYFEGTKSTPGALTRFSATALRKANYLSDEAAKKRGKKNTNHWPYRAFWLTIAANADKDGNPIFTKVGSDDKSSFVVVPVAAGLPDPKKWEETDLNTLYVGDDLLHVTEELWTTAEAEWTHQWDSFDPEANNLTPAEDETEMATTSAEDLDTFAEESGL